MADEVIGAKLSLDANDAMSSMKAFKQQLREAEGDLVSMASKFGENSKQAIEAAKRVASLRDAIGDAKSLADAFNPDQKFRALSQSLSGVLGGFSALTGAMGLLGVESDQVQKQLLKVQSAMALSQGLNQVGDAIQSFKNLGTVLVNSLGRNGLIGLAIAGVTVLGGAIVSLIKATDDEIDAAKKQEEITRKQYEASKKLVEGFDLHERKLRALGKTELEITTARKEATKQLLNDAIAELKSLELIERAKDESYRKQQERVKGSGFRGAGGAALFNLLFGVSKKEVAEAHSNVTNIKSQIDELEVVILELDNKIKDLNKPKVTPGQTGTSDNFKELTPEQLARINSQVEYIRITDDNERKQAEKNKQDAIQDSEDLLKISEEFLNDKVQGEQIASSISRKIAKDEAEEKIKYAEAEAAAKIALAQQVSNVLGSLGELVGRQTAAGKVLAIAEIASNTAIGYIQALDIAQKSAKATGPAAAFAFPIFYASQIAAVLGAAAKAKQILSGGDKGSSVFSSGISSGPSFQSPLRAVPQFTNTRLDSEQINQIGNAANPIRAFVVEHDITTNQERIRRLNRAARI